MLVQPPREQVEQELEYRKCAESLAYFFFNYWKIKIPEKMAQLPIYREDQQEALDAMQYERYLLCLKARQIGWTTMASCYAFWAAAFAPEGQVREIALISKTEREAAKIKARITFGQKNLPLWMKQRMPKIVKNNRLVMEFESDSRIEAGQSQNDPVRGDSLFAIIVDEWAFLDNPSGAWASIEPATNVGGKVIGFSTPNGYGSWFHRFWLKAKGGTSNFKPMFFPWWVVPGRDEAWYQNMQANHEDPDLVEQEYAADDVTCWLKSGSAFFNADELPDPESLSEPLARVTSRFRPSDQSVYFIEDPEGMISMYEKPDKTKTYVIGADVAGGGSDGDWSVATVLDAHSGTQVAQIRAHIPPDDFGVQLVMLGQMYNTALLGIERNNMGVTTIVEVQNLRYPNLYYDRNALSRRAGTRPKQKGPGWSTSAESKHRMLTHLKSALGDDLIEITDKQTAEELFSFQATAKKTNGVERIMYEGRPHDDCVIALAIAWQMVSNISQSQLRKQKDPNDMRTLPETLTMGEWAFYDDKSKPRRRVYSSA